MTELTDFAKVCSPVSPIVSTRRPRTGRERNPDPLGQTLAPQAQKLCCCFFRIAKNPQPMADPHHHQGHGYRACCGTSTSNADLPNRTPDLASLGGRSPHLALRHRPSAFRAFLYVIQAARRSPSAAQPRRLESTLEGRAALSARAVHRVSPPTAWPRPGTIRAAAFAQEPPTFRPAAFRPGATPSLLLHSRSGPARVPARIPPVIDIRLTSWPWPDQSHSHLHRRCSSPWRRNLIRRNRRRNCGLTRRSSRPTCPSPLEPAQCPT